MTHAKMERNLTQRRQGKKAFVLLGTLFFLHAF